jgi:hypothetical protein
MNKANISRALIASLAFAGLGAIAVSVQAHHSFAAQYDSSKPIKLGGVVTKLEWTNPHVYVWVDVTNAKTKKVENWGFEMGPPHMLQQRGWKRNTMQIGDELEVHGTRARDGSSTANARRVMMTSTGEVLGTASSEGQTITAGDRPAQ